MDRVQQTVQLLQQKEQEIDNNNIYRVFQQQGFDRYGKGLGIAKISTLTPTEYDEKIISKVEARFFPSIIAAHTYNFNNGPWRSSDQKVFIADINKVRNELNWSPKVSTNEGLDEMLSWVAKL